MESSEHGVPKTEKESEKAMTKAGILKLRLGINIFMSIFSKYFLDI